MSDSKMDSVALQTLSLLEQRLQRLEFLLTGHDEEESQPTKPISDPPVVQRVQKLQHSLNRLAAKYPHIADLLRLQALHPTLFSSSEEDPSPPLPTIALPTVLSAAPIIQSVSSQLLSLSDSPSPSPSDVNAILPPTSSLATWASLAPRIAQLDAIQSSQAKELARLRVKSAQIVSRWYEVQTLAAGRVWVEWEGRVKKCEREVRRREVRNEGE